MCHHHKAGFPYGHWKTAISTWSYMLPHSEENKHHFTNHKIQVLSPAVIRATRQPSRNQSQLRGMELRPIKSLPPRAERMSIIPPPNLMARMMLSKEPIKCSIGQSIVTRYSKGSFKYEVHFGDVPSWQSESKMYQFMVFCVSPTTTSFAVLGKKFRDQLMIPTLRY